MQFIHQLYSWFGIQKALNSENKPVPDFLNGIKVGGSFLDLLGSGKSAPSQVYDFTQDGAGTYTGTPFDIPTGMGAIVSVIPMVAFDSATSAILTVGDQTFDVKTLTNVAFYVSTEDPLKVELVTTGATTAGHCIVVVDYIDTSRLESVEKA